MVSHLNENLETRWGGVIYGYQDNIAIQRTVRQRLKVAAATNCRLNDSLQMFYYDRPPSLFWYSTKIENTRISDGRSIEQQSFWDWRLPCGILWELWDPKFIVSLYLSLVYFQNDHSNYWDIIWEIWRSNQWGVLNRIDWFGADTSYIFPLYSKKPRGVVPSSNLPTTDRGWWWNNFPGLFRV